MCADVAIDVSVVVMLGVGVDMSGRTDIVVVTAAAIDLDFTVNRAPVGEVVTGV